MQALNFSIMLKLMINFRPMLDAVDRALAREQRGLKATPAVLFTDSEFYNSIGHLSTTYSLKKLAIELNL